MSLLLVYIAWMFSIVVTVLVVFVMSWVNVSGNVIAFCSSARMSLRWRWALICAMSLASCGMICLDSVSLIFVSIAVCWSSSIVLLVFRRICCAALFACSHSSCICSVCVLLNHLRVWLLMCFGVALLLIFLFMSLSL